MSAHTPGPWSHSADSVDPEWTIVTGHGGLVVANVNDVNDEEKHTANARLIAAAPELLAELQNIANAKRFSREHFADDSAFCDWAQSRARAAIARATSQPEGGA